MYGSPLPGVAAETPKGSGLHRDMHVRQTDFKDLVLKNINYFTNKKFLHWLYADMIICWYMGLNKTLLKLTSSVSFYIIFYVATRMI